MPPDPPRIRGLRPLNCNSCILLFYHPPTSNFIENPGISDKVKARVSNVSVVDPGFGLPTDALAA